MELRRRRRGRRSWPQRFMLVSSVMLAIACFGTAAIFAVVRTKASELPTYVLGSNARDQQGTEGPRNILLVGTDSAAGLDKDSPIVEGRNVYGHLADVIMILRIDPSTDQVSLMSIPRDTWVPVAPEWSKTKINTAYGGSGGPEDLIATIKHNFGIPIDNFVEVDWAGFRQIVKVLDGVPVYLDHPVSDPTTGLWLIQTGCIVIDPDQALAYSRSRHFRYQESSTYSKKNKWITDATSDLGRISRQQDFIKRAAQRAIDRGLRNPATAVGLVNAGLDAVKVDARLTIGQVLDLLGRFRNFAVEALQSQQLPTESAGSLSTVSYQNVLWEQAEPMLNMFRGIRGPGETVPSDVLVDVAAGPEGVDQTVAALDGAGFVASSDDTSVEVGDGDTTTIRFGAGGIDAARLLARHLDATVDFEYVKSLPGRRIELALGAQTPTVRSTPVDESAVQTPTIPPTTTSRRSTTTTKSSSTRDGSSTTLPTSTSAPGSSSSAVSSSTTPILGESVTTTTVVGMVPINAESSSKCG